MHTPDIKKRLFELHRRTKNDRGLILDFDKNYIYITLFSLVFIWILNPPFIKETIVTNDRKSIKKVSTTKFISSWLILTIILCAVYYYYCLTR